MGANPIFTNAEIALIDVDFDPIFLWLKMLIPNNGIKASVEQ